MIKNVYYSSRKVPLILVRFECKFSFLDRFLKNIQIRNFMKILPMETEFIYADGRTDMTKLIASRSRNFANANTNYLYITRICK